MKNLKTLLAVSALLTSSAFAAELDVTYDEGATFNASAYNASKVSFAIDPSSSGLTNGMTLGANAHACSSAEGDAVVLSEMEFDAGAIVNISNAGIASQLSLNAGALLKSTAAADTELDLINAKGAATVNSTNAYKLNLAGSGNVVLTGAAADMYDWSAYTGSTVTPDVAVVIAKTAAKLGGDLVINGDVSYVGGGALTNKFAHELTANELAISDDVAAGDMLTTGGKLILSSINIGGNSFAEPVTAH